MNSLLRLTLVLFGVAPACVGVYLESRLTAQSYAPKPLCPAPSTPLPSGRWGTVPGVAGPVWVVYPQVQAAPAKLGDLPSVSGVVSGLDTWQRDGVLVVTLPNHPFTYLVMFEPGSVVTLDGKPTTPGAVIKAYDGGKGKVTVTIHPRRERYGASTAAEFTTAAVKAAAPCPGCKCGCVDTGSCLCKNCNTHTADPTSPDYVKPKTKVEAAWPDLTGYVAGLETNPGLAFYITPGAYDSPRQQDAKWVSMSGYYPDRFPILFDGVKCRDEDDVKTRLVISRYPVKVVVHQDDLRHSYGLARAEFTTDKSKGTRLFREVKPPQLIPQK